MHDDHHRPLPPELDWGNMKDGILDKMHALEQAEFSHTSNKRSRKRILLLLSLFFFLSSAAMFGLFFFLREHPTNHDRETVGMILLPELSNGESDSILCDDAFATPQQAFVEVEIGTMPEKTRIPNLQQATVLTGILHGQNGSQRQLPDLSKSPESLTDHGHDRITPFSNFDRIPASGGVTEKMDTVKGMFTPLSVFPFAWLNLEIPEVKQPAPVRPDFFEPGKGSQAYAGSQRGDSAFLPTKQPTHPFNQVILEGGINFWNEGFGNSNPDRAEHEAPIPSFQLQGFYLKGLKQGYFLMAGLQYQRLESKLEYRYAIDNYQVTLKDTILQVRKNLFTGEETIIRGDAVHTVPAVRRIRHFNKTQLVRASLAIGKNWRFHSFQTDVYLGGAVNGIVRNQGRMLFEDEIIDYNGTSNPFFRNQWTVDGVAGARMHYFPYQKLGITTGFQAQRSLMNWSNQSDVRFYPLSFSLQLGLSYLL